MNRIIVVQCIIISVQTEQRLNYAGCDCHLCYSTQVFSVAKELPVMIFLLSNTVCACTLFRVENDKVVEPRLKKQFTRPRIDHESGEYAPSSILDCQPESSRQSGGEARPEAKRGGPSQAYISFCACFNNAVVRPDCRMAKLHQLRNSNIK